MDEVWKDIPDYEGLYQVSNMGRVKSLNYNHTHKEKIMKLQKGRGGYLNVSLYNKKAKRYFVHCLVCQAFIPNPDNLPEINHKDCNPGNNKVNNLEWCNRKYNCNYGARNKKLSTALTNGILSKTVVQMTLDNQIIKVWPSTREPQRNGFNQGAICACCRGKRKTYKGYKWQYANP